jgi:hypothetical protein
MLVDDARANAAEQLQLQRVGGNPFKDEVSRAMVGQTVRVTGVRLGDVFRFTEYRTNE